MGQSGSTLCRLKATLLFVMTSVVALAQTPRSQEAMVLRLAIELGAERDPSPIPLGPGNSTAHGVAYDRFTQAHLAARVAAKRGAPLDPLQPPATLYYSRLIVVAVPLVCGDRVVNPIDVDIFNAATPVSKYQPARGAAIQRLMPGAAVPPDAIGVMFSQPSLRGGQFIRVSYAGPVCNGTSRQVMLTVSASNPVARERPQLEMAPDQPSPSGPVTLTISGVVDLDGRLRYATAPEASTPIGAAALAAARKMKFEPARVNGAPVPWTAGVILTFGGLSFNSPTHRFTVTH